MWALLSLLFAVVVFVVSVLAAWGAWTLAVLAVAFLRRRTATKTRTAAWVVAGLPASVVTVAALAASLWWHGNRPGVVFETEFGFAPPADTTFLNSHVSWIGDSGHVYLHFRSGPQSVARIVAAGFVAGADDVHTVGSRPAWFVPPVAPPALVFTARPAAAGTPVRGRFASEHATLIHDSSTGEVWYAYVGVD